LIGDVEVPVANYAFEPFAEPLPDVTQKAFRDAMARLGSAVHVVTTDGPGGTGGFTASAVTSVTDTPPTLLVCVNTSVSAFAALRENGVLCINTLGSGHREVSRLFSEKVGLDARFGSARWRTGITGAPILADAVVSFDCRIIDEKAIGTHSVFFCEVLGLPHEGEDEALIYFNRAYHRLGSASRMEN